MNSIIVFSSLSFLFFSPQLEVELSPGTICIFFFFGHKHGRLQWKVNAAPAQWRKYESRIRGCLRNKKNKILIIYFIFIPFFSPFSPKNVLTTHTRVKQRPCVHLLRFDSLLSDELWLLCILCLSDSLYLPGAFAPQWIKNGANRSRRILNGRQPWLWAAGMCHKLTPGQYVLLTLIINVIFGRGGKRLSSWWKTQMSIYMADQPCIDMHKCSFFFPFFFLS